MKIIPLKALALTFLMISKGPYLIWFNFVVASHKHFFFEINPHSIPNTKFVIDPMSIMSKLVLTDFSQVAYALSNELT
jgi:hypothetical protein